MREAGVTNPDHTVDVRQLEACVRDVLNEYGLTDANVRIVDRGALECVLRARVETAVLRCGGDK